MHEAFTFIFFVAVILTCLFPAKAKCPAQPVFNADLVPTLATLTHTEKYLRKGVIDGKDITSLLLNNKTFERDIYWKYNLKSAFRSGKWKLINDNELYDLSTDPGEKNNLVSVFPEKLKEVQQKFKMTDQLLMPPKK